MQWNNNEIWDFQKSQQLSRLFNTVTNVCLDCLRIVEQEAENVQSVKFYFLFLAFLNNPQETARETAPSGLP